MNHERPLTVAQAVKHYPEGTAPSTIIRHIKQGVRTRGGAVVKLEGAMMGRRWTTTAEAIERFRDRLTVKAGADPTPPERSLTLARSEAYLDALGM